MNHFSNDNLNGVFIRMTKRISDDMQIGLTYSSLSFGRFKIISYKTSSKIGIQFVDTGYTSVVTSAAIRSGRVKDYLVPTVFGVGFMGDGEFTSIKHRDAYQSWAGMLYRCYSSESMERSPTYRGCSVSSEWHSFQDFAPWFYDNHISGYHLDKDIKIDGNKIYGPDTCAFVSHTENNIKAKAKTYLMISPCGERTEIYNMSEFCRGKNLVKSSMCRVNKGIMKSHRGWLRA